MSYWGSQEIERATSVQVIYAYFEHKLINFGSLFNVQNKPPDTLTERPSLDLYIYFTIYPLTIILYIKIRQIGRAHV